MSALCLSELARDLAVQPEPKWTMTPAGQWVQTYTVRIRDGQGWREITVARSTK